MFPSKGMESYMTEMNRLFPKTEIAPEIQHAHKSPYSQMANRSSSSTDSMSPETYPEVYKLPDLRPESRYYSEPKPDWVRPEQMNTETMYETPKPEFQAQRRPIVGRKIIDDQISPARRTEQDLFDFGNIWQPEEPMFLQQTPPKIGNIFIEQKNYTQNVFYELFSGENRGFEIKTPVKTASPMTTTSNSVSPSILASPTSRFPNLSPVHSNYDFQQSPIQLQKYPRSLNFGSGRPHFRGTEMAQKMCSFCRKNGETPVVYMTHMVKERVGNKQIVTCPILRSHVCSTCRATGDDAHTITYCPVLRSNNNGAPLRSTTITLKNTRVMSNGRRRY